MLKELDRIGKRGVIQAKCSKCALAIQIVVLNIKSAYGRTRYLVTPVAGSGEVWVEKVAFSPDVSGLDGRDA